MDISRLIIPLITYLLTLNHNYLPRHLLINMGTKRKHTRSINGSYQRYVFIKMSCPHPAIATVYKNV